VAEKYNVKRYAKFNHTVVAADWKHDEGLWHVKVKEPDGKEFTDTCNVLINGTGVLK
jgi:cation diffusion facilitator CzcD-associated flavoprotein CzcO